MYVSVLVYLTPLIPLIPEKTMGSERLGVGLPNPLYPLHPCQALKNRYLGVSIIAKKAIQGCVK